MKLAEILDPCCIVIEHKAVLKQQLFSFLLDCVCQRLPKLDKEKALAAINSREELVSTSVGHRVAFPHAYLDLSQKCIAAVAVCPDGVDYEQGDHRVNVVVLLLATHQEHSLMLKVLGTFARTLRDDEVLERLIDARSPQDVFDLLASAFAQLDQNSRQVCKKITETTLTSACEIRTRIHAKHLLIITTPLAGLEPLRPFVKEPWCLLAARNADLLAENLAMAPDRIVTTLGRDRSDQIKVAVLFALGKRLLRFGDMVVCVSGRPGTGALDTITTLHLESDLRQPLFIPKRYTTPGLSGEVLERVLELALDLGKQGREGKKVGTIFVLGDTTNVLPYTQQMIINPFHGYAKTQRNVLDPSLEETIKEFSSIDGAFLIRGDGIIETAGTFLKPGSIDIELDYGFGTRHRAAAGLTAVTESLAIVLSQSSGKVTLFKSGTIMLKLDPSD